MAAKCEMFVNCSRNFIGICKHKYDFKTWNTKGNGDVKEKYGLQM